MASIAPAQLTTARRALLNGTFDVVSASEPPDGSTIVPGVPDAALSVGSVLLGLGEIAIDIFGQPQPAGPTGIKKTFEGKKLTGDSSPCPGPTNVRLPNGQCFDPFDVVPGGDPVFSEQVPENGAGPSGAAGQAVNGRFGVGRIPRVEAMAVRRCPPGMALGKDGVCYDGLSRNSPKREWPMGMKPLLTPGERNAIRIAGVAAGKLSRSQKSLKKTAKALEKAC